jgi:tetratricopeptide (TPR) repeat protein
MKNKRIIMSALSGVASKASTYEIPKGIILAGPLLETDQRTQAAVKRALSTAQIDDAKRSRSSQPSDEKTQIAERLIRAQNFCIEGQITNALSELHWALSLQPKHNLVLCQLGYIYSREENFEFALYFLNRALELQPNDNILALSRRGACFRRQGEYEKAFGDLNEVLLSDPTLSFARTQRAMCYLDEGNDLEALADLRIALVYNPKDILARNLRIIIFRRMNMHIEALAEVNRTLQMVAYPPHIERLMRERAEIEAVLNARNSADSSCASVMKK